MQDKAALIRCESYDQQEVDRAVAQAFALVGGLGQWIKPGMTVAIKANLLMKKKPEAFTTTHPAVIEAVAKQVRALGATAVIGIAPAARLPPRWYMEYTGLADGAGSGKCRRSAE